MLVKVEEIPEGGLAFEEPIPLELLARFLSEVGEGAGFRATKPSELRARLHKVSDGVLLQGNFNLQMTTVCKRCLQEVPTRVSVPFTLSLVSRRWVEEQESGLKDEDERSERAASFRLESADEEWFDGKVIDFEPILREQLLLSLPMYVVCREDCRGLCSSCGQDLNEKPCGCEPTAIDPRLAILKDIKLN